MVNILALVDTRQRSIVDSAHVRGISLREASQSRDGSKTKLHGVAVLDVGLLFGSVLTMAEVAIDWEGNE